MLATFFFFYPFSLLYSPISFLVLNQLLVETHFLCWTSPLFVLTNICFFGIYVDCFSVLARSKWLNEPGEKTQYSLRIKKHKCRFFFSAASLFFFFVVVVLFSVTTPAVNCHLGLSLFFCLFPPFHCPSSLFPLQLRFNTVTASVKLTWFRCIFISVHFVTLFVYAYLLLCFFFSKHLFFFFFFACLF